MSSQPEVLCAGLLVVVHAAGAPHLLHQKKELVSGEVITVGSGEGCSHRFDLPYLDEYHCQLQASQQVTDSSVHVAVKSISRPGRWVTMRGWRQMNVEKTIGLVKNKAYLLRDGFEIRLGKSQTEYMSLRFVAYDVRSVYAKYEFSDVLGRGGFGAVHAVRNRSTNAVYAIKVSSYGSKVSPGANDCVRQEYKVLKAVEHDNIVAMKGAFRESGKLMLLLELAKYGDVLNFALSTEHGAYGMGETLASNIARQMSQGIQHLHRQGICHCDIKLQNALIFSKNPLRVKVIDFGLSCSITKMWMGPVGTPTYQAPEVTAGGLWKGPPADAYSLGVSTFVMLTKQLPFVVQPAKEVNTRLIMWQHLPQSTTEEAKHFLSIFLQHNPKKRACVSDALIHKWILRAV